MITSFWYNVATVLVVSVVGGGIVYAALALLAKYKGE